MPFYATCLLNLSYLPTKYHNTLSKGITVMETKDFMKQAYKGRQPRNKGSVTIPTWPVQYIIMHLPDITLLFQKVLHLRCTQDFITQ